MMPYMLDDSWPFVVVGTIVRALWYSELVFVGVLLCFMVRLLFAGYVE